MIRSKRMDAKDLEPRIAEGEPPSDTVSLLDLLGVLVKHRRLIVIVTFIVTALTFAFLLATKLMPVDSPYNFYPDYYKPTARILLQDTSSASPLASVSSSALGALAGLVNISSGRSNSAQLAMDLLKFPTIQDKIAAELDFLGRYHITKAPKASARGIITKSLTAKFSDKSGILEVSYQDVDPEFATRVVNEAIALLEAQFKELTLERATNKKNGLKEIIDSTQQDADKAMAELVAFQKRHGIVDIGTQASASEEAIAKLNAESIQKQLELNTKRKFFPENDPAIVLLKDQIEQYQKAIASLQAGSKEYQTSALPSNLLPEVSAQYGLLRRTTELQLANLYALKQQYESARIEELDTSQSLQVIEPAEVPEVKAGPTRSKIAVIAAISGLLGAVLLAFIREYFHRARLDPFERGKLALIKESVTRRRR